MPVLTIKLQGDGLSKRAIAARFGVTDVLIGKIVRRQLWAHIGREADRG